MGSVSATNSGLSNLFQTLENSADPAVASALSSPTVQAALQKAPESDLVKLSDAAVQLQGVDVLFGVGSTANTNTATNPLVSLLSPTDSSSSTITPAQSLINELAGQQATLQAQDAQDLFGMDTPTTGTLLSTLG